MEKQELSYSDCKMFNKYMIEAMEKVIERDFKAVYENIDSCRDMLTDWRYDGDIGLSDYEFFAQKLNQATEALCLGYTSLLIETLMLIKDSVIKMMIRDGIKRDN